MQPGPTDRDTRAAYDQMASDYARMLPDMSTEAPLDRAVLAAFAEMVGECRDAPVADVGCGTGRVTKHLHDAGIPVLGFDLSARMAAVARASQRACPSPPLTQPRCRCARAHSEDWSPGTRSSTCPRKAFPTSSPSSHV